MWLFLAFSAPVLWAVSTHIDKYLVERFFKNSSVGVLLIFTALDWNRALAVHRIVTAGRVCDCARRDGSHRIRRR